jgi:fumarate hydratase subunit beta
MTSSADTKRVETPLTAEVAASLRAGERVALNGVLYTARDAAHQRLVAAVEAGEPLPLDMAGQVIYYCGPTPARPGHAIGSAGPTTASRMDPYAPTLYRLGVKGTIGKGGRSAEVRQVLQECGAVYFLALGGAGALLAQRVRSAEVVAYEDLGTEAIRRLVVVDFPVIVAYDSRGAAVSERL